MENKYSQKYSPLKEIYHNIKYQLSIKNCFCLIQEKLIFNFIEQLYKSV